MKAGKGRSGYQKPMGSELRALREQREASAPTSEAGRREASFLRNIAGAGDDLEWILFNQAWTQLDFERVGDWWEQRVLPVLEKLDLRPSASLAERVIAAIEADEQVLPKTQRRTQREIASIAKTSQSRVSRLLADSRASGSDLGGATGADDPQPEPAPADIPDALRTAIENTAASVGAGVASYAKRERPTVLCPVPRDLDRCNVCGAPLAERNAGYLRCQQHDGRQEHVAWPTDDGLWLECRICYPPSEDGTQTATGEDAQSGAPVDAGSVPAAGSGAVFPGAGPGHPEERIEVMSAEEFEAAVNRQLDALHLTREQLAAMAAEDDWVSLAAKKLWLAIKDSPAAPLDTLPVGAPPASEQPGQDSPTGQDRSDAGANFSDAPESAAIATTGRPEIDHHQESGVSPGGVPPEMPSVMAEELGDGGGTSLTSLSLSDHLMHRFAWLMTLIVEADVDAIGPQMLDDDVATLLQHADDITDFVGRLIKARTP